MQLFLIYGGIVKGLLKPERGGELIEKLFNTLSVASGILGGLFAAFLGEWDILLKTMVVLVVLDYITGIMKAIYKKEVSSEIGFIGILKKAMIFVVICFSYMIQLLMKNAIPLREIVLMFFIANEGLSLLENAAIFIPIPQALKDVLLQLRNQSNSEDKEDKDG